MVYVPGPTATAVPLKLVFRCSVTAEPVGAGVGAATTVDWYPNFEGLCLVAPQRTSGPELDSR